MWARIEGGVVIARYDYAQPITGPDGTKHPAGVFGDADALAALGIVPLVREAASADGRYYQGVGWETYVEAGRVVEREVVVQRPLSDVRAALVAAVSAEANRRIGGLATDATQKQLLALGMTAVIDYGPDSSKWPADLQSTLAASRGMWAETQRLRGIEAAKQAHIEIADFASLTSYDVTEGWS